MRSERIPLFSMTIIYYFCIADAVFEGYNRMRMRASLSERIAADDHGARVDIAFLILTTLIIFS